MPKVGLFNARTMLPLIHSAMTLALLSNLYLPRLPERRKRDLAMQQWVEGEARAGRWPRPDGLSWEADYFGPPRQIAAMYASNLPALLVAGVLVVPSNALDRLLQPAPGRVLPSTRLLIFIALFAGVSRLSWKWRKRSSAKIAERTYEKRTEALHS
jgi:hypothetical protein